MTLGRTPKSRRWSKRVSTGPIKLFPVSAYPTIFDPMFARPCYKSSIQIVYKYDGVMRKVNFLPVLNWTTGYAEAVPA